MKLTDIKGEKPQDYGKCPNCGGKKWADSPDGANCVKCNHPHGEPLGDADEDRIRTQRSKVVKTVESAMRAFDDLHAMLPGAMHAKAIDSCKGLLGIAKGWMK